ncbi:MAG: hypothetical protein A2381_05455 [Bdellovibrionales bacterium RIFOXYB1_FULL_37_110]|nr:MAG: hypothetical protein A2417_16935 [Bdellovibrionales bacterium RIFOXYC1_FULL_37_79]OFZ58193.1 MAG: hypothetical protein A2381_05455 [Bdellovibrionales bacterium RIFOXYB1_FULL_37_110]OFZ61882.1 MAG: hypothetical protein A2577_19040 [Bdellovibrionales bacterium RIFOXYD1_FULL_36_51]
MRGLLFFIIILSFCLFNGNCLLSQESLGKIDELKENRYPQLQKTINNIFQELVKASNHYIKEQDSQVFIAWETTSSKLKNLKE